MHHSARLAHRVDLVAPMEGQQVEEAGEIRITCTQVSH